MSPTRTTLATGTSKTEPDLRTHFPQLRARGFTLIEIMVVLVIIGLMVAGAVLALGSLGRDRSLEQESKRLEALLGYARERAELQTREFGLRMLPDAYEFMVLEVGLQQSSWRVASEDDALRKRQLPAGLTPELYVEGRKVVLQQDLPGSIPMPQIMLLSSGEMSSFELRLRREASGGLAQLRSTDDNRVEIVAAPVAR